MLAWLGEDADRVLFFVTHWRRRTFTGRTFHLDPKTGTQNTEET